MIPQLTLIYLLIGVLAGVATFCVAASKLPLSGAARVRLAALSPAIVLFWLGVLGVVLLWTVPSGRRFTTGFVYGAQGDPQG